VTSGVEPTGKAPVGGVCGGWLSGVAREPSPNCDDRPPGSQIDLVVVHNISLPPGCYGGGHVVKLFMNELDPLAHPYFESIAAVRVSAHLLIDRAGRVTQFVPFDRRAWHAGVSEFGGRERCNDFSIGVELEGTDFEQFTDAQYATLNAVLQVLARTYPLRAVRGHSHIAPDRKTDPGPCFDWARIALPASISLPSPLA
jgi:N-acetyl-anhydromuramoyl-L-alanine amidase